VKAVHPDAALAHHQDGPAVHCLDDIVAALHQPGACLAAHLDEVALGLQEARRDADNVAKSKVCQPDAEHQELFPQDVLPQARFPVQRQAASARPDEAQKEQAQLRDVQR
jgi:hypothetical protein